MNGSEPGLFQSAPNGKFISVHDTTLYYEEWGEGHPLVFLHGFTLSGEVWRPIANTFADRYRVIVVDLRGHGRSTNPSKKFTHRQSALDIYALLDALDIEEFSGVGFSGGGMTLLHMASQQRSRIRDMVLVGATSYFPEECRAIQRELTVDSPIWDWAGLRERHAYGDEQIRMLITQFHDFSESYDDMNFTPPYLSTITARTLIVHGDRDPFFPIRIPVEMYQAIPRSTLWIIPNGDHVFLLNGREAQFCEVVRDFLKKEG